MEDVATCNEDPTLNDVSDMLLFDVTLYYEVVGSNVLDCINCNHVLILIIAFTPQILPLEIVQVGTLHAHRNEDLVLGIEAAPARTREGNARH
jgi:hypothetical protein